jgi:hypothetical protein
MAACHLDGSSGYIWLPDSSGLRAPFSSISFGSWFRFTSATQLAFAQILGKNYNVGGADTSSWGITMDGTANSLKLVAFIDDNAGTLTSPSTAALSINTWYYAVASWDGTGRNLYLSVYDSTLTQVTTVNTGVHTGVNLVYDTSPFSAGAFYCPGATGSPGFFLNGDLGSMVVATNVTGGSTTQDRLFAQMEPAYFPAPAVFACGFCGPSALRDVSLYNAAAFTVVGGVTAGTTPPPYSLCYAPQLSTLGVGGPVGD